MQDGMGSLRLTDDDAVYTGSTHWATILEDVGDLDPVSVFMVLCPLT